MSLAEGYPFHVFIFSALVALLKRDDVDIEGGWKVGEP
jgi:hypothetical protein